MQQSSGMNTRQQTDAWKIRTILIAIACMIGAPAIAQAGDYFNGFEVDTDNWFDLTRVTSGTGGVTSASGGYHAISDTDPYPFTRWGGYNDDPACSDYPNIPPYPVCPGSFPANGYDTSIDIYLDVNGGYSNDSRLEFTSAISTPAGGHRRDFVFNCGFYNDDQTGAGLGSGNRFICSASNNSAGWPSNPGRDPAVVATTPGWYTLRHQFRDDSGVLAVHLSVLDSGGTVIKTWTLSDSSDVINSTVGGNRYGWFATNALGTIAIDNTERTASDWSRGAEYVTPDVIFGSGNSNGNFNTDRQNGVELGLRAKIPYNGLVNNNGDGTYSYTLAETGTSPNRKWNFDWTVNTDFDGSSGLLLDDLTYELGVDADPGLGVDFVSYDWITPTAEFPCFDHSIGDNSTANGGGVETNCSLAGADAVYAGLLANNNVLQQSWRPQWAGVTTYDPDIPGTYGIYLLARDSSGAVVARTDIQVLIGGAPKAVLECVGFEPPMNLAYLPPALGGGKIARRVKKNRVFPFKAMLVDSNGNPVTDITAPKIEVLWNDTPLTSVNVTDQALVNGKRTDGTDFFLAGDYWHFNLASRGFADVGNHTGIMASPGLAEYVIEPTCEGVFIIEP